MTGQTYIATMERPPVLKKKRAAPKKHPGPVPQTPEQQKWNALVDAALARLDHEDYDGFWEGIDTLNAFADGLV